MLQKSTLGFQKLAPLPFIQSKSFATSLIKNAGHSKWANIKHRKAAVDAAKAAVSFRVSKKITVMAKLGGYDPNQNAQLANAIDQAKSMSVPKKVIENAIKRATGELKNDDKMEPVLYEGMGPGGVSVVIEAVTDNKNRTIGFVRPCFSKYQLGLTPTLYMFDKKGMMLIDIGEVEFDDAFEVLLELGCEDMNEVENPNADEEEEVHSTAPAGTVERLVEVITDPTELHRVASGLKDLYTIKEMEIGYIPNAEMMVEIKDKETKATFDKFLRSLEELDDVTQVYTNLKEE